MIHFQYTTARSSSGLAGLLSCLLMLGACSTAPRIEEPSPPAAIPTNDTRETVRDTAEPAPKANDPVRDTLIDPSLLNLRSLGEEVALRAIAMVGKPYRYGGADLHGFDCSGLVLYVYRELGIELPRSAAEQHHMVKKVDRDDLQPGDLLFFRINRKRISHVGIYVGDNRFVHAPQSGKNVVIRNLDDEYYAKHWVGAGRVL
jgi:cell wall-associated NlpC family hydrolase